MVLDLVGIMNVFNEADILQENLEYLNQQGISLLLLDNGSTDGSYQIAQRYLAKNVVRLETLRTDKFSLRALLEWDYKLIGDYGPDWVLWIDVDEFLESPFENLTLSEAVQREAEKGYNVIQFDDFEFWPTERDPEHEISLRRKLRFYSWRNDYHFKCWEWHHGTYYDMHRPRFPQGIEEKISPVKFLFRHYKIRSYEHGLRKIFEERVNRVDPEEKAGGINVHYDVFTRSKDSFVIDSRNLTEYREDGVWNLERKYDMAVDIQRRLRSIENCLSQVSHTATHPLELAPQLVLWMVYCGRPDLQQAIPAAFSSPAFQSLIDWAAQWGITIDSAKPILEPYASWYLAHRSRS